ncbi:hypothetical protein QJS04_geneDACA005335 [Acorus gramineus]|uniref:RRM domain-containing protein n=1 Tax=Acorus gramineus TaxID=55184 RepID=A0AAV9B0H7_ACOGR|nr:hypothetical protein QJS04_geneDACA005335 [Acorus gramineus]
MLLRFCRPSLLYSRTFCTGNPSSDSKLFVAGLSWAVDERSLKDAFSFFGDVTEDAESPSKDKVVRIMYDKNSGRSRGFGFVSFSGTDEARSAKDAMDGKAFMGRPLKISFALEKSRDAPVVVPRLSTSGESNS